MIITINSLITSLFIKLSQEFDDDINIYSENVEQGFDKPCFFIEAVNSSNKNLLGKRYLRKNSFDIKYFPEVESNNGMQEIASTLYDVLEILTLENGEKVRGTKMSHKVLDGVLHFYVNFDMVLKRIENISDYMEDIEIKNNLGE